MPGVRFSAEQRARAVRLVVETAQQHGPEWVAIQSVTGKIGASAETVRKWVRRVEVDAGTRPGLSTPGELWRRRGRNSIKHRGELGVDLSGARVQELKRRDHTLRVLVVDQSPMVVGDQPLGRRSPRRASVVETRRRGYPR
jgi:transposase